MSGPAVVSGSAGAREEKLVAGKYRLGRVLGEGGMGVVYAAEHVDLQKRVAIKIMREELTSQRDLVERMLGEARTVARLRSEHVAQVIDVGRLPSGAPFIVMEYLEGCDLGTKLAYGEPLLVELTVAYVLQACEAVAEAHVAGIVHRDIKPENLFLSARTDGEPIIKVLDFGISRNMKSAERDITDSLIAGSPDYMSPESMRTDPVIAAAADIWSLGAVLYESITGRRPFEAATVTETCARVLGSEPIAPSVILPSIPAGLESVVLRCLRKEPSQRFATVVELAAALAPFGPDGAIEQAERVARVASGGRWNPRNTATPKRLSFPSYSDVPNSTSAVVAEPVRTPIPTVTQNAAGWRRWHTGAALLACAAVVVLAIGARGRLSPTPSRAQVAVVAAPAVPEMAVAAQPAATSTATAATATATAATVASSVPAPRTWGPPRRKPQATSSAIALVSSSFSYDDAPPSSSPPPSPSDVGLGEPTPAPGVAESAVPPGPGGDEGLL